MACTCRPTREAAETILAWAGISARVPVFPGLWDLNDTPSQVQSIMTGWRNQCGIVGGFMWLYDDFVGNGLAAQYASAINNAVNSTGFTLSGPSNVFLNQSSTANAAITITPLNGFTGTVNLSLSTLPKGVRSTIKGTGNKRTVVLTASPAASTGFTTVTVTGTSGTIKETVAFTLAVSAGVGTTGTGTTVNLSSEFDINGIIPTAAVHDGRAGRPGLLVLDESAYRLARL